MKDYSGIRVVSAPNNVYPLDYHAWQQNRSDREDLQKMTDIEYITYWIRGFIDGDLQFNNKDNLLQFTIDQTLRENGKESHRELWVSQYDYESWNWDIKDFTDPEDRIRFEASKQERDHIIESIAINYKNRTYSKVYQAAKKERYYLKNSLYNDCYIVSLGDRSYRYGSKNRARTFSGIQKEKYINHFSIERDHFFFEKITL